MMAQSDALALLRAILDQAGLRMTGGPESWPPGGNPLFESGCPCVGVYFDPLVDGLGQREGYLAVTLGSKTIKPGKLWLGLSGTDDGIELVFLDALKLVPGSCEVQPFDGWAFAALYRPDSPDPLPRYVEWVRACLDAVRDV